MEIHRQVQMEGNVLRQENAMWRWRIGAAYLQTYRKAGQRPGTESHLRPPEKIDATDVTADIRLAPEPQDSNILF